MDAYAALKASAEALWAQRAARPRIEVGLDSSNQHAGAAATLAAVREAVSRLPTGQGGLAIDADVGTVGDLGMCWAEPLVTITRPGEPSVVYGPVTAESAAALIEDVLIRGDRRSDLAVGTWADTPLDGITPFSQQPYFQVQRRYLLARCGIIDPENIDDYLANGGYAALDKALSSLSPEEIVKELLDANLTGRGGANFPAGRKWDFLRTARGDTKYMVCNADEGDPGAFVNRILLESDPHLVLEGIIIGGYVTGASHGFIYIRDEYPVSVQRVRHAIQQARERGLLGPKVLGSDFSFDLEVIQGAGAYVCGEETGLIASIQDYRGMPRIKPPFPAQAGVFMKPTNVNNVETYAYAPGILMNGIEWFTSVGHGPNKGTKLFSLSGRIQRVCIIEVDMGTPIRTLMDACGGGLENGRTLKGIQQGGPLGGIIPPDWLDTALDPTNFNPQGTIMGSGGLIFLDERDCVIDMCKWLIAFDQDESCGRCTTCRVGSMRMVDILDRITRGQGVPEDLKIMQQLSGVMQNANCVHGQFVPGPFNATFKWFREEFDAHILEKRCPSLVCRSMVEYRLPAGAATGERADRLVAICPVGAIIKEGSSAVIIDSRCIRCGLCAQAAPDAVRRASRESYAEQVREVRYA